MTFKFPVLRVVDVTDSDSLRLEVDLGFHVRRIVDMRLAGTDTPKVNGDFEAEGLFVKSAVEGWVGGYSNYFPPAVILESEELDERGRVLGDLKCKYVTPMSPMSRKLQRPDSLCRYLYCMNYGRRYRRGEEHKPWTDEDLEIIRWSMKENRKWEKERVARGEV